MKTLLKHKLIATAFCLTTLALSPTTIIAAPSDYLSLEVTITPSGSEWLRANTNIQAVLVDAKGQTTTKPSAIKITNAGKMSCTISSPLITENAIVQPNQTAIFNLNGINTEVITLKDINVTFKLWQGDLSNKTTANNNPTVPVTAKPNVAPPSGLSRRQKFEEIDKKLKIEVERLRDGAIIAAVVPAVVASSPVVTPADIQPKGAQVPPAKPVVTTPPVTPKVEPVKIPPAIAPTVVVPTVIAPPIVTPEIPKGPAKPDWMAQTMDQINEYGKTTKTTTNFKVTKTEIIVDSNATTNLAKTLTTTTIPLDAFTIKRVFTKTGNEANPISYGLLLSATAGRNFSRHRNRIILQDNSSHEDDANVNLLPLQFSNEATALEAEKVLTALKDPTQRDEVLRLLGEAN